MSRKTWVYLADVLFGAGLAVVLLSPVPIESTNFGSAVANWVASLIDPSGASRSDNFVLLEIWLNVLIFVPFGALIFLSVNRLRFAWSLGTSAFISVGGELAQHFFLTSRVATLQDVILNMSGAFVGALLGYLVIRLGRIRRASR